MKHSLLLALPLLALLACSHGSTYNGNSYGPGGLTASVEERPKTAAELRAELLAREQAAPTDYLAAAGTYRRNLIDQLVLEGDIVSTATLATYKDPVLLVTWRSKTGTDLATKQYPVYELLTPGGTAHFKLKTAAPSEVATVAMGIAEATAVE